MNITKNKDKIKDINNINKITLQILKYLAAIFIGVSLLFVAYCLGVTVREKRRKRANELKDENYEYIQDKNKDINKENNDLKNQLVELNSNFGK